MAWINCMTISALARAASLVLTGEFLTRGLKAEVEGVLQNNVYALHWVASVLYRDSHVHCHSKQCAKFCMWGQRSWYGGNFEIDIIYTPSCYACTPTKLEVTYNGLVVMGSIPHHMKQHSWPCVYEGLANLVAVEATQKSQQFVPAMQLHRIQVLSGTSNVHPYSSWNHTMCL